jgi:hypothetical protein
VFFHRGSLADLGDVAIGFGVTEKKHFGHEKLRSQTQSNEVVHKNFAAQ